MSEQPTEHTPQSAAPLLAVENLVKHFPVRGGLFGRAEARKV